MAEVRSPAGNRGSRRLRAALGAALLAEIAVFVLVASFLGVGWTILLALATSALGGALLARQGTRALADLQERARERQPAGRALGDAGLIALGGLLMVLPGFLGDLLGLLCLLPGTRALPRALIARGVLRRLPDRFRGPVRVQAARVGAVPGERGGVASAAGVRTDRGSTIIEGEIVP